ncbi:glucuronate isomerase [Spongiibacter sp. IMCC21906]|uniref:glucuronate isomerase n=1 Tax=Spongiibacter sp. IMCC21906 TaxID=1620392 RepID=UPI00062DD4C1|nr:glucuronate isomerase [Spongiibacter sp. IMCC21906]AKH69283.1 glucuronate isomerase [Spongiibacter sp. IMCC21906]
MNTPLVLHPDRLFPADDRIRSIARFLYQTVKNLPIISPHGHTDPRWFADNNSFTNATELLIRPDHYVFRMLYSQGVSLDALGIPNVDGNVSNIDPEDSWLLFAKHYYLFQGTPSRLWLDHVFAEVFKLDVVLNSDTADHYFAQINAQLASDDFRPRALFEQFNIEVLATTESPLDDLQHHANIQQSDWSGRVITTFRPDPVVDPGYEGFADNLIRLGELTNEDTTSWSGYLAALRQRRRFFQQHGATASDHGHPSAATANLSLAECEKLFHKIISQHFSSADAELFRAQLLTEMAAMSVDDGLVMQLHPGVHRNHNQFVFTQYGRDKGGDIPVATEYVQALQPLLNRFGNHPDFRLIVFTLDESRYARELAPLAGHYPCLKLGPAWWFNDSPEGMRRYRQQTTETAGFYNTVGFNDDTRAFLSIPARHDVARRIDCSFLAELVADHRLTETEAVTLATELSYSLAKNAYHL